MIDNDYLDRMIYPIPTERRIATLIASLVLAGVIGGVLWVFFNLETNEAPFGIRSLQLAGSVPEAERIIRSWRAAGIIDWAYWNIYLDFLFLLGYSTTLSLFCIWSAQVFTTSKTEGRSSGSNNRGNVLGPILMTLGLVLAWDQWLAAFFDALENVALLVMLQGAGDGGAVSEPWPLIATTLAGAKFALIFAGLGYIIISLLIRLARLMIRGARSDIS